MTDPMRVAHLSDLHLLSLTGVRLLEFINKRWIGGLNLLAKRSRHHHTHVFEAMVEDINAQGIDHVVCSGDVTNLGLKSEFRFARSCFDGLALGPENVTVIPGNHDVYVSEARGHFDHFFADYHRTDTPWRVTGSEAPAGTAWPTVRVRGPVAVVGVSSCVPTPWFTAYGRVDHRQLERLRAVLSSPELADKLRVVAIHHPPAGRYARHQTRGLRGWRKFAKLLAETGAELVLHGHEHRDLRHELPGPGGAYIPVLGIQSGSYHGLRAERTARYRIFDVSRDGVEPNGRPRLVGYHLRMWDPEAGRFVEDTFSRALPGPSTQATASV
ncbi:metallophosphoesterase family protein [Haliangium ochraceum]|uniref:Metallophosphoesterase n=1 Tax=Haliangium ochraceum (strain DSM 14365 / JCM 11303 / SMP-2) TaxID=502025 RepID=D0LGC8_HALO1|nr:metallophosphoesterase [Haliangium ochraceum]ACY18153.1 metallophosphoesterase [Haliangium ochraceum DSM 14365]